MVQVVICITSRAPLNSVFVKTDWRRCQTFCHCHRELLHAIEQICSNVLAATMSIIFVHVIDPMIGRSRAVGLREKDCMLHREQFVKIHTMRWVKRSSILTKLLLHRKVVVSLHAEEHDVHAWADAVDPVQVARQLQLFNGSEEEVRQS